MNIGGSKIGRQRSEFRPNAGYKGSYRQKIKFWKFLRIFENLNYRFRAEMKFLFNLPVDFSAAGGNFENFRGRRPKKFTFSWANENFQNYGGLKTYTRPVAREGVIGEKKIWCGDWVKKCIFWPTAFQNSQKFRLRRWKSKIFCFMVFQNSQNFRLRRWNQLQVKQNFHFGTKSGI